MSTITKPWQKYSYYIPNADEPIISEEGLSFLRKLFNHHSRHLFVKINSSHVVSNADTELIGEVADGSINVDGKSAVRRSVNLSFVTNDFTTMQQQYWALQNKFKLELGLENLIEGYSQYSDKDNIVWFPFGEYYITSFSPSLSPNSFRISISGQDKMSKLNGTIGGTFTQSTSLSQYDQLNEEGEIISTQVLTLPEVIKNIVSVYGEEPLDNIIIKDLDQEHAQNLLEYQGTTPLYVLLSETDGKLSIASLTTYGAQICYNESGLATKLYSLSSYYTGASFKGERVSFTPGGQTYYCQKVEYGQTVGYEQTEMIYPGELTGDIGTTAMAALDKIKNIYANYEYFYDVFGRFIFQKKPSSAHYKMGYPTFEVEAQDKSQVTKLSIELPTKSSLSEKSVWQFIDLKTQTSFNSTPAIGEIKNDFTVWGKKKSSTGDLPVHMRIAIQEKPHRYTTTKGITYSVEAVSDVSRVVICDWREIIYQMALDENQNKGNLTQQAWRNQIVRANRIMANDGVTVLGNVYPTGVTGYEDFYADMLAFWRKLYNGEKPISYAPVAAEKAEYWNYADNPLSNAQYNLNNLNNIYIDSKVGSTPQERIKYVDTLNLREVMNNSSAAIKKELYKKSGGDYINLADEYLHTKSVYYKVNQNTYLPLLSYALSKFQNTQNYDFLDGLRFCAIGSAEYKKVYRKDSVIAAKIGLLNLDAMTILSNKNGNEYKTVTKVTLLDGSVLDVTEINIAKLTAIQNALLNRKISKVTLFDNEEINNVGTLVVWTSMLPESADYISYVWRDNSYIPLFQVLIEDGIVRAKWEYYLKTGVSSYEPILERVNIDKSNVYYYKTDDRQYYHILNLVPYSSDVTLYLREQVYSPVDPNNYFKAANISRPIYNWTGQSVLGTEQIPLAYFKQENVWDDNGWNKNMISQPWLKIFWLDFLEPNDWYAEYSKEKIGKRQKAINDNNTTALVYPETPGIDFTRSGVIKDSSGTEKVGLIPLPDVYNDYFVISNQGKSVEDAMSELLYKHMFCAETVSTQALPIYFLQPNEIIEINDSDITEIHDFYSINSLSFSLGSGGLMSLNLTKLFTEK